MIVVSVKGKVRLDDKAVPFILIGFSLSMKCSKVRVTLELFLFCSSLLFFGRRFEFNIPCMITSTNHLNVHSFPWVLFCWVLLISIYYLCCEDNAAVNCFN